MGRLLLERDPNLLRALISLGLEVIKKFPPITARQVRAFYFYKYGLQNRETIKIMDWGNLITALKSRNQQTPTDNQEAKKSHHASGEGPSQPGRINQQTEPEALLDYQQENDDYHHRNQEVMDIAPTRRDSKQSQGKATIVELLSQETQETQPPSEVTYKQPPVEKRTPLQK